MAAEEKEIILSIKTDTSQASAGVTELKTQLQSVNDTPVDKPFKSFKTEIREATLDAKRLEEQFGKNSKEFATAAKRVAELKDRFGEFNQSIAGFNPDNKLEALVGIAKGATGAIQGVTGAFSFMGVESEKATEVIARLQGLMAFSQALNSVDDIKNSFKNLATVLGFTKSGAEGTTIAIEGQTVATEGASLATRAFGIALKSIGIGLIIAAIAYLIENFDKLTEKLGLVNKAQNNLNATLKDYQKEATTAITKVNEMKASFDLAKKGTIDKDVVLKKYNDTLGDSLGRTNDLNKAEKLLADKADAYIKMTGLKAQANALFAKSGEEAVKGITADSEDQTNFWNKIKVGTLQYIGDYGDALKVQIDGQNAGVKEIQDKAKKNSDLLNKQGEELYKQADELGKKFKIIQDTDKKKLEEDLLHLRESYKKNFESIKAIEDDAIKKMAEAKQNDRQKELTEVDFAYKEKIKSVKKTIEDEKKELDKAKKDGWLSDGEYYDKLSKLKVEQTKTDKILLESKLAQELAIEKKYHDKIVEVLNEATETEYDKKKTEINKKYNDLIKVANEGDKALLESRKKSELTKASDENTAKINVIKSETNLVKTERENAPDENDSPGVARTKIFNLTEARISAENEAFELKKLQLVGQQDELQKLQQEHQTKVTDIQKNASDTRKVIDKNEKEAKLNFYSSIGNSATQLSDIIGKQTVAGKALAIAGIIAQQASTIGSIVMSTQQANLKAVAASPLTAGQPWVTINTIQGVLAGATSVAAGAKAISAIGGSGGGGASNVGDVNKINNGTAPQINAQSATQQQIQDVRVTNDNERQPIKAYITNSDLQTNQQKTNFLNSISTI